MTNYVIINGVNSNTINGLGINELPPITKPSMRVLTEEIDGRDGDITTNLGYSAYDKTITIGLFGTGYDIDDIVAFFNGEGIIVFSNEADKYYNYKIINQIDYVALQKFKSASVTFHCQPFKYPLEETPIEIDYDYIEEQDVESATLNTAEATMKVNLLGNTSQTGTPTPDNPIPVNVVSGDNEVVVTGKNLIDSVEYNKYVSGSGNITSGNTDYLGIDDFVRCKPNTAYTISFEHDNSSGQLYVAYRDINNSFISRENYSTNRTFTTPNNAYYLYAYIYKSSTFTTIDGWVQLELGSTATPYEPYQSTSYPVNLPVENLFDVSNYDNLSSNGITETINAETGEITLNGTATATAYLRFDLRSAIPSGTIVSYSANNSSTMAGVNLNLTLDGSTKQVLQLNTQNAKNQNITIDTNINRVYIQVNNGTTLNNFKIKPQLERGSKVNSYTPYGTTPIELCKKETYQDKFIRNSGKNLFDKDSATLNNSYYTLNNNGTITTNITYGAEGRRFLNNVLLNAGTYTLSFIPNLATGNAIRLSIKNSDTSTDIYNDSQTITNGTLVSQTFTLTETANIGICIVGTSNNFKPLTLTDVMLNEGSTALPYEPYGNGDWYLEKHIEKKVFDGSESYFVNGQTSAYNQFGTNYVSNKKYGRTNFICNKFTISATQNQPYLMGGRDNSVNIVFNLLPTDCNYTTAGVKTWMASNQPTIYYVLNTPTYTKIEGTLKDELDALQKAQSYKGTTNINQINNDLPFKMNLKAIEEGSNEGIVNNIGNTYAKPTIELEGTGEINIYLNDVQMLKATLTDKMTIDIAKMEAYNPYTSVLLNRQLIGDISKFLLPSGESTIRIDGNLTKATISNYTRWL